MNQAPYSASKPRNSYELVGRRLQGLIASPRVQRIQLVEVSRRDDESPEAWLQVIQDIGDTVGIRIEHLDDQVQGCMWITDRKWWHIGMYCPLLKPVGRQLWWKGFQRDDDYIESLEEDLWEFKLLVDGYEAALRSKAA